MVINVGEIDSTKKFKDLSMGNTFYFIDEPGEICLKCYGGYVNLTKATVISYTGLDVSIREKLVVRTPTRLVKREI